MALARFSVSLDEDLLKALDGFVIENSLPNRSQGSGEHRHYHSHYIFHKH